MATYQIQGNVKEAGVNAEHLVIAYKADRTAPATMGEELGRATAAVDGNYTIQFDDWTADVVVVCLDMSPSLKYNAKVADWRLGTLV